MVRQWNALDLRKVQTPSGDVVPSLRSGHHSLRLSKKQVSYKLKLCTEIGIHDPALQQLFINPRRARSESTVLDPWVCPSVCYRTHVQEICQRVIVTCSVLHWLDFKTREQAQYANKHRLTSTGSACSVYLGGTTGHNEWRVSTPTCYLLL